MLLLFLVSVGMALGVLDGRSLRGPAVTVVIGFAFLVTITAVIALFIAPPGGKAAMAVAFGGFVGPAATARSRAGGIYSVAVTCEADANRFKAMAIRDGQIVALAPGLDGADDLIGGWRCWSTVQA